MPDFPKFLFKPNVRLCGDIENQTVLDVLEQLDQVRQTTNPVVFELTTLGGDPDAARRIALEIRLCRTWHNRETYFLGKTSVLSAGVTIMAAFPRECRFLTADTELLIHERRLEKTIALNGPMQANLQILREQLALLESAERLEREGFAELAEGSQISGDEIFKRARENFYMTARQALDLRLIQQIL